MSYYLFPTGARALVRGSKRSGQPTGGGGGASLIGQWKNDETSGTTATDAQGLSNGTYEGTVEFSVDPLLADGGTSLGFNGTDTGLQIPHVAGMALERYSVVRYIQADALPATGEHFNIWNKDLNNEPGGASVELINDAGIGRIRSYSRTSAGSVVWVGSQNGQGTVVAGTAYRVVFVVDTDGVHLYLDDPEIASSGNAEGWASNDQPLYSGIWHTGVTPFNGVMDELRLYDDALTASETAALPAAQSVTHGGVATIELPAEGDWTDHGVVIAAGADGEWDEHRDGAYNSPNNIVEHEGTLYAFYVGADGLRGDGGPANRKLGVATSTDGQTWTKHASNPLISYNPAGAGAGVNEDEEGIFSSGVAIKPDGSWHAVWGGLSAISSTGVEINIHYSTASDGITWSPNTEPGNQIIGHDDTAFAGNASGGDDETFPGDLFWDESSGEFQLYYVTKEVPQYDIYHVHGSDLETLSGVDSSTAVDDNPQAGDLWRSAKLIDRGNDNIDLFASIQNDGSPRGQIYRLPITSRNFANPGAPVNFYDFTTQDAINNTVYATVFASRSLGKWIMLYREDDTDDIKGKTAPLTLTGGGSITTSSIDAWGIDADSGETIGSATGGTMPVVKETVDPTDFVSGATGTKDTWTVQFRNESLGTWAQLANGDFEYTPGSTAGTDDAEYRVSDDGGSTFSDWTPITIEVVARPPGPMYLVEDYSGSNQNKVQSALNDADANSGTAATLQRDTVWDEVNDLSPGEAHMLGIKTKRSRAVHTSGDLCGQNVGSGKCSDSDWTSAGTPGYFDRVLQPPLSSNSTRVQWVLCDIDGNSQQQALRETTGDNPTPSSPCGTCFGDASGSEHFNLQRQAGVLIRGNNSSGAANRRQILFKRSRMRNTCGDGFDIAGSGDLRLYDSEFIDCFRGAWTINGGNTVVDAQRCKNITVNGDAPGIDYEVFSFGGDRNCVSTVTDCEIHDDFDVRMEDASDHTFTRCIVGPGLHWLAGDSSVCRHTDGEIRYTNKGGGTASNFPREAFRSVSGGVYEVRCDGTKFVAWGDAFRHHGDPKGMGTGDQFEILLDVQDNTGWLLKLVNCSAEAHNLPGSNTVLLFRAVRAVGTGHTVRLDGLTISSDFAKDCIRLNGQKVEHRNVSHEGFPGAGITEIVTGAGQYVAL